MKLQFKLLACLSLMLFGINTVWAGGSFSKDSKKRDTVFSVEELRLTSLEAKAEVENLFTEVGIEQQLKAALEHFRLVKNRPEGDNYLSIIELDDGDTFKVTRRNNESFTVSKAQLIKDYQNELVMMSIHKKLKNAHPNEVLDEIEWAWNNAVGSVHARIGILYCSLNEYVALFGTQVGSAGNSGSYPMGVYDIVFEGKMISYGNSADEAYQHQFSAGEVSFLEKHDSRNYIMEPNTYMIDYATGNVVGSFYKGIIGPYLFVNFDAKSLNTHLRSCIKSFQKKFKSKLPWAKK